MKIRTYLPWIILSLLLSLPRQPLAQHASMLPHITGWQQLTTAHFDILFLSSNKSLANKAARYAEMSLHELSDLYDYNPQSRYTLFLLFDLPQLSMMQQGLAEVPQQAGFFGFAPEQGIVIYSQNSSQLYGAVREQVADLLLKEYSYGKNIRQTIQGQSLLNYAKWYSDGMTDYLGHGWTYEDEMWLNTLSTENIDQVLNLTLEGDAFINQKLRKSVWRYICHEYGEHKVAEIIYFVKISNSLEAGVISVLGITLNTLTGRWRENLREVATNNSSGRNGLGKMPELQEIPLKSGYELIQFAYNAPKNRYALYLNKGGKHQLFIYDPESGDLSSTPIISSLPNEQSEGRHASYPLAWSKDGTKLFTTAYQGKSYDMVWYDLNTNGVSFQPVPGHINRIFSADWAHNGQLLSLSALYGASPQIFIVKAMDREFIPVTDDPFDNIDPCWSFDDQAIFFSSNRDTSLIKVEKRLTDSRNSHFDIFSYQRNSQEDTLKQITFTPSTDEYKPQVTNSFEVVYLTNESGIYNLKKSNIFLPQESYLTDLNTGIFSYQAFEEKLIFSTPIAGKAALFSCRYDLLGEQALPQLSLLRTEVLTSYAKARKEAEEFKKREALLAQASEEKTEEASPTPSQPKKEKTELVKPPKKEEGEEGEKKVRYYIFDDYEEPYEVKKAENDLFEKREKEINQQKQSLLVNSQKQQKLQYEKIEVSKVQTAQNGWKVDQLSVELGRRPDAGIFARLGGKISDKLHNQEIEATVAPFYDFRNFNGRNGQFQLQYTNLRRRMDYYLATDLLVRHYRRINTLFPLDSAIYRYDKLELKAGIRYPLSNYSSLSLEGAFNFLDRRDQKLLNQQLADQSDRVASLGLIYQFEKTKSQEGYAYKGWKGAASLKTYYSVPGKASLFNTAALQLTKYTEIRNRLVLANQFVAGYSLGNHPQRFYIGGTGDWIPPYIFFAENDARLSKENALQTDLLDFSFQEFITPMRGFWFFSRSGSRYFALSSELRIPISRLTKTSLNASPLYNLELIPFVDVGSVWSSGNPFSSTNPTDTRLVGTEPVIVVLRTLRSPFVVGVGTGLRTNFLGYSLRVDLGWGIEDAVVEKLAISLSLGRNF